MAEREEYGDPQDFHYEESMVNPMPTDTPPGGEREEMRVRKFLWLSHGHRGMYGDDGEMQCVECQPFGTMDYKRSPLADVLNTVDAVALHRASTALSHPPDCWRSHHACAVAKIEREQEAGAEVAEWQWRWRADGKRKATMWRRVPAGKEDVFGATDGMEVRALYTHPAPRDVSEAMVEAFANAPLCDVGKWDDTHDAEECDDCIRVGLTAALRAGGGA